VGLLVDEITEAALEAIEQAAGEAAKAAVLSMVEREAVLLREINRWRLEADIYSHEVMITKKDGRKNTVLGVTGTLIIGGR
jgi:hypothetical protein